MAPGPRQSIMLGALPAVINKNGDYEIKVRVTPRSSKLAIESVEGGIVKIRLTSPPVEGEANKQLIELLSDELNVRKSSISIGRGPASRIKTVVVKK